MRLVRRGVQTGDDEVVGNTAVLRRAHGRAHGRAAQRAISTTALLTEVLFCESDFISPLAVRPIVGVLLTC